MLLIKLPLQRWRSFQLLTRILRVVEGMQKFRCRSGQQILRHKRLNPLYRPPRKAAGHIRQAIAFNSLLPSSLHFITEIPSNKSFGLHQKAQQVTPFNNNGAQKEQPEYNPMRGPVTPGETRCGFHHPTKAGTIAPFLRDSLAGK
ncbi:hypothetical protein NVV94_01455 [Pseudomonas sp. LS1212]|uniref:hypothetical protein n=1 Tax=Pseudomonas sp. LS1212 TaxID=2972478 RepID=UPI00215CCE57|nr:hypothetical protein [Pseudomonas sp. LS1212]UVJ44309.1 hypothetical protein NVV94_01455 [Pseudomonas sp. LS1212]